MTPLSEPLTSLDLEYVRNTSKFTKILNTLLSSGARCFATRRGHLGVQLPTSTFTKLQPYLGITLNEPIDGLIVVGLANGTPSPAPAVSR